MVHVKVRPPRARPRQRHRLLSVPEARERVLSAWRHWRRSSFPSRRRTAVSSRRESSRTARSPTSHPRRWTGSRSARPTSALHRPSIPSSSASSAGVHRSSSDAPSEEARPCASRPGAASRGADTIAPIELSEATEERGASSIRARRRASTSVPREDVGEGEADGRGRPTPRSPRARPPRHGRVLTPARPPPPPRRRDLHRRRLIPRTETPEYGQCTTPTLHAVRSAAGGGALPSWRGSCPTTSTR